MSRTPPIGLVVIAFMVALVCTAGSLTHELFFEVSGIAAVYCIVTGVRRYRPPHPWVWGGLAVCISVFLVSFGVRLALPGSIGSMTSMPLDNPDVADYLDLAGVAIAVAILFQQSRIRDDARDPTNTLDSLIVAAGASVVVWLLRVRPVFGTLSFTVDSKVAAVFMGCLLTWLTFCASRLAMTFGSTRNRATLRLSLAIVCAIIACLFAADNGNAGNDGMEAFAGSALLLLGWAAMDSSMSHLTSTGNRNTDWIPAGHANQIRGWIAVPAALAAPSVLLVQGATGSLSLPDLVYLVLCELSVTGLVIVRLTQLMKLREWSSDVENVSLQAEASLLASPTLSDTYSIAATTMMKLLPSDKDTTAAVVIVEDDVWTVVESAGAASKQLQDVILSPLTMKEALDSNPVANQQICERLRPELGRNAIVEVVAMVSQRVLRGALISITTKPTSIVTRNALYSLATKVTLSLEAISFDVGGRDVDALLAVIRPEDQPILAEVLKRARGHGRREQIDMRSFRIGSGSSTRWFSLCYQPIYSTSTLQLVGFEAFLRWVHPTLGLLPPGSFLALAEQNGSMDEIGRWVVTKTCEQLAEWKNVYSCDIAVTVNISPTQLASDSIIAYTQSSITDWAIEPDHLVLDIYGQTNLNDVDVRRRLSMLRDMGCRLVADNIDATFVGYDALQQIPFTDIKIDCGLIKGAFDLLVPLGKTARWLGLTVTAKCLENIDHLELLDELNADFAQGFLMGVPLSAMYAGDTYLERFLHSS